MHILRFGLSAARQIGVMLGSDTFHIGNGILAYNVKYAAILYFFPVKLLQCSMVVAVQNAAKPTTQKRVEKSIEKDKRTDGWIP